MAKFSLLELTAIAVALDEETAERRRRWAVHPAWSKREFEGEFVTLYKELIDEEMKFYRYFRTHSINFSSSILRLLAHTIPTSYRRILHGDSIYV